jgi:glycosyltransferase involved in cell wall biosynthesis
VVEGSPVVIAVLIPTLGRPGNIQRVIDDLEPSAPRDAIDPLFIVEAHDTDTIQAIKDAQRSYVINERAASYAGAINTAVEHTTHPHLFIGADDLHFHDGWLEPLLERAQDFGLVGTNDLHNPAVLNGDHATHFLVTREYCELSTIDGQFPLLHEGYTHNYTDTEAVATAKHRGQWTPCLGSHVEHIHWAWGLAPMDPTYQKGANTVHGDEALYRSRSHLWM